MNAYLFEDMETGEEFFVECETIEEAFVITAELHFTKPLLKEVFTPEDADILGYDTY